MNILLIGGTGVISTSIVRELVERGDCVTVFNRRHTDDRLGPQVRRIHGDRDNFLAFENQFAGPDSPTFDAVIDMICFNSGQAESALRAFAGRTAHFIFCSTVCVYGNTQTILPTPESTPRRPHSAYGQNKLAAEEAFLRAHANKKFGPNSGLTIVRPSHTFGPGGAIINNLGFQPTFIDRLRRGMPIIISGDGHGLWQSAYADDVGAGFAALLGRKETFGEAYNMAGDEVVTWDRYTRRTAAAIGAPEPHIIHIPADVLIAANPKRYEVLADIFRYHSVYANDKIRRVVPEYGSKISYEEGIRRTVAWLDAHKKNEPGEGDGFEDELIRRWNEFLASR